MKDNSLYLHHILDCIEKIERFTGDDRDEFMKSELVQDAVIRNLQMLSESVKQIPDRLKDPYPSIDWRAIAAFRNILVHEYLGVNMERVWEVVASDLPPLNKAILSMLEKCK